MSFITRKHQRDVVATLSALVARSPEVVEGNCDYAAFLQGAEPMLRQLRDFFVSLGESPNIAAASSSEVLSPLSEGDRHECY